MQEQRDEHNFEISRQLHCCLSDSFQMKEHKEDGEQQHVDDLRNRPRHGRHVDPSFVDRTVHFHRHGNVQLYKQRSVERKKNNAVKRENVTNIRRSAYRLTIAF